MGRTKENTLVIRAATLEDICPIRRLLQISWHATYDEAFGANKVEELIQRWHTKENLTNRLSLDDAQFLIALDNDSIVAVAFAKADGDVVNLHQLYVLPECQMLGTGTQLLSAIKGRYTSHNIMRLEVAATNQSAIDFYHARGFEITGRTENCVECNSGIRCYLMEWRY